MIIIGGESPSRSSRRLTSRLWPTSDRSRDCRKEVLPHACPVRGGLSAQTKWLESDSRQISRPHRGPEDRRSQASTKHPRSRTLQNHAELATQQVRVL